jgi:AraC-like DNA-binding protein
VPVSIEIEERLINSPLLASVWRSRSERGGSFTSVAVSRWELVVTRRRGRARLTLRGPETRATPAPIPEESEFLGITFEHGAYLSSLPVDEFVDRAVDLPLATGRSFWLNGSCWHLPTFENADVFVRRLVRSGVLGLDPVVSAALHSREPELSPRSVRRHFLRATGLTPGRLRQIDRARQAAALLQGGASASEAMQRCDFFDQPHLIRSLRRFIGYTPSAIGKADGGPLMSLSYKTAEFRDAIDPP